MSKEINKYLNLSIVMSVLFAILGVILVVSPNSSLDTIAYLLAAFLLVYGTYNFIDSFAIHPIFFFMKMASSVISILLGIIIFLNPEIFKNLIPIALGIFFIINGIFKTRMAFIIKNIDNYQTLPDLYEHNGNKCLYISGELMNFKITSPDDLELAKFLFNGKLKY